MISLPDEANGTIVTTLLPRCAYTWIAFRPAASCSTLTREASVTRQRPCALPGQGASASGVVAAIASAFLPTRLVGIGSGPDDAWITDQQEEAATPLRYAVRVSGLATEKQSGGRGVPDRRLPMFQDAFGSRRACSAFH
ncbi:MAG TPA: hypothetical protein VGF67_18245 [Ktedonobacteraceae bacterium]